MNYQDRCKQEYDAKYSQKNWDFNKSFPAQFCFVLRLAAVKSHTLRILDLGGGAGEYSRRGVFTSRDLK